MTKQKQVDVLNDALQMAAGRFEDLALIIEGGGTYDNAGFFRASADRCRAALDGKPFNEQR